MVSQTFQDEYMMGRCFGKKSGGAKLPDHVCLRTLDGLLYLSELVLVCTSHSLPYLLSLINIGTFNGLPKVPRCTSSWT